MEFVEHAMKGVRYVKMKMINHLAQNAKQIKTMVWIIIFLRVNANSVEVKMFLNEFKEYCKNCSSDVLCGEC